MTAAAGSRKGESTAGWLLTSATGRLLSEIGLGLRQIQSVRKSIVCKQEESPFRRSG